MLDNVKGKINKAKEQLMKNSGPAEHVVEAANENLLEKVMSVMVEQEEHGWEFVTERYVHTYTYTHTHTHL
jgi:hypothetical protein